MGPFEFSRDTVASTIQLLVVVMVVLALCPFLALHVAAVLDRRGLPSATIHVRKQVPAGEAD